MHVTDVKLIPVDGRDKLKAAASIVLDDSLAIHGIRIVETSSGLLLAMPSRRLCGRCPRCGGKNHLLARYCNECGSLLPSRGVERDARGREKLYVDLAHPISRASRQLIESAVFDRYFATQHRSSPSKVAAVV